LGLELIAANHIRSVRWLGEWISVGSESGHEKVVFWGNPSRFQNFFDRDSAGGVHGL
jgi:hypothetical protein